MDTMRDIMLIQSSGQRYGVWKDEIESVQDLPSLHRLPLSPACIAGVAIIDARTVTLADLLVCIGRPGVSENGKRRILIPAAAGRNMGFLIEGDAESLSVPPDQVLPMPDYLSSELISSCFLHGKVPVPIVSLSHLYYQLLHPGQDAFRGSLTTGAQETPSHVLVYRSDDELFSVMTSDPDERPVPAGPITELSLVPQFVKGIGLHEGQVLPVIDLGQRIRRRRSRCAGSIVVHRFGRASFGLLVDELHAVIPLTEAVRAELPRLARPSWITAALLLDGEIVPLLDLEELLSVKETVTEGELAEHYPPDSQFPVRVGLHPVVVVEFSLLGARHALPKTEVEDIVPFRTFRTIPDVPEIVLGVTEHEGALLPVLDLAMVFGRRSIVSSAWSMILIRNGGFRAFVVTDAVFGERSLPVDVQRTLPIVLPHRVVYACYPDADGVRLVLNVRSIAVHFEKSLVRELLPALSSEMKLAPAELVPSLLGDEAETASGAPSPVGVPQPPDVVTGDESRSAEETSTARHSELPADEAGAGEIGQRLEADEVAAFRKEEPEQIEPAGVQEEKAASTAETIDAPVEPASAGRIEIVAGDHGAEERPASAETTDGTNLAGEEKPLEQTLSAAPVPAETAADASREEKEDQPVAAILMDKTDRQAAETLTEQTASVPAETVVDPSLEGKNDEPAADASREEKANQQVAAVLTDEAGRQAAETLPEQTASVPPAPAETVVDPSLGGKNDEPADSVPGAADEAEGALAAHFRPEPEPQPLPERAPSVHIRPEQETEKVYAPENGQCKQDEVFINSGAATNSRPQPVFPILSDDQSDLPDRSSRKRWLLYAGIAAALAAFVLIVAPGGTSRNAKQRKETGASKAGPAKTETKPREPVEDRSAKRLLAARPSLVLEIPAPKHFETAVYVVVKDDTLWSISERFTGNPFNYPRIAGENRIADPDLIFPGQEIRLRKKE